MSSVFQKELANLLDFTLVVAINVVDIAFVDKVNLGKLGLFAVMATCTGS